MTPPHPSTSTPWGDSATPGWGGGTHDPVGQRGGGCDPRHRGQGQLCDPPGQSGLWQYLLSVRGPTQSWPPLAGGGSVQPRWRIVSPRPPQLGEQGLQGPQGPNPPSRRHPGSEQRRRPCRQVLRGGSVREGPRGRGWVMSGGDGQWGDRDGKRGDRDGQRVPGTHQLVQPKWTVLPGGSSWPGMSGGLWVPRPAGPGGVAEPFCRSRRSSAVSTQGHSCIAPKVPGSTNRPRDHPSSWGPPTTPGSPNLPGSIHGPMESPIPRGPPTISWSYHHPKQHPPPEGTPSTLVTSHLGPPQ